ncbi:MAG: glycosyltransferase family 4 protein, partial [Gemmatimonadales bacterium]
LMTPHLLLTYDFPPIGGGLSRYMAELARAWPGGGLHVSTGTHDGSEIFDATLPGRIHRVQTGSKRLRTLPGLLRWARHARVVCAGEDIGFQWCGNFKPAAYPARWVKLRLGIGYGIIVHGMDMLRVREQVRNSPRKRRVAASLFGGASVVVANSGFTGSLTRSVLDAIGLGDRIPVRAVPLGTDPLMFRPGIDTDLVRERFGLRSDRRWLLTVARLTRHKGIDTGIAALARLAGEYPALSYAVAGTGERREELETRARACGLADRVRFLGAVSDEDLPALYNTADIYLGVSRESDGMVEGFGISLVEASASGLPVIAGRSGGISDAVRENETGLLVDPDDPAAVAAAVSRLLDDTELGRTLGAGGRLAVEQFYNWDRVAGELAGIGEECATERS